MSEETRPLPHRSPVTAAAVRTLLVVVPVAGATGAGRIAEALTTSIGVIVAVSAAVSVGLWCLLDRLEVRRGMRGSRDAFGRARRSGSRRSRSEPRAWLLFGRIWVDEYVSRRLVVIPAGIIWGVASLALSTVLHPVLPHGTAHWGRGDGSTWLLLMATLAIFIEVNRDLHAYGTRRFGGSRRRGRAGTGDARDDPHVVSVIDARPLPGDGEHEFEPYFVAICDCGWTGRICTTSDEAFANARTHSDTVKPGLERPVG